MARRAQLDNVAKIPSYREPKVYRGLIFPETERKVNVIFAESSVHLDTC